MGEEDSVTSNEISPKTLLTKDLILLKEGFLVELLSIINGV
jgi:hypothetical protein